METSQKLLAHHKVGKFTLVESSGGGFRLITFITPNGNFVCTYPKPTEAEALKGVSASSLTPEYIDSRGWKIIRTVDPMELMGGGYEKGQKVRILVDAKDLCLKHNLSWNGYKESMLEDGFGFIKGLSGSDWAVFNKDKSDYFAFPPSAIEPYFDEEVTEIAGVKYSKADIEALVKSAKDLKPIK